MDAILHPSKAQILRLHEAILRKDGGAPGIRDEALLESALAAPRATFGGEPIFNDISEVASAYLFYLCRNHPFSDGNKRVAFAMCLVFLKANGLAPKPDGPDWETLVLDVAASRIDRQETTLRLKKLLA